MKKVKFSTIVDEPKLKSIKMLGIEQNKNIIELIDEALQDLLKKYDKPSK